MFAPSASSDLFVLNAPAEREYHDLYAPAVTLASPAKRKRKYDPEKKIRRVSKGRDASRSKASKGGDSDASKKPSQGSDASGSVATEVQGQPTSPTTPNDAWGMHEDTGWDAPTTPLTPSRGARPSGEMGSFEKYEELALASCCDFFQISEKWCVVQGFDRRYGRSTSKYYHLQLAWIGEGDLRIGCQCPDGKKLDSICVHEKYFREYQTELFPRDGAFDNRDDRVVLVMRERWDEKRHVHRFSVEREGYLSRAVVTHKGTDDGGGKWKCAKDSGRCMHVIDAQHHLQQLLKRDPNATHEEGRGEDWDDPLEPRVRSGSKAGVCISYLPVHPPVWAALPTDEKIYEVADPDALPPRRLDLDATSACPCSGTRTVYDPARATEERPCTIYAYNKAYSALAQVQKCPTCPPRRNRKIGPDPRNLGIFNYNNTTLITHELLDEYTSQYTTSETPFTSFCKTVARRYRLRQSKFMDETLFRSAWMAYVELQVLEGDMTCDECGIEPETVIFDGVTLAFGRKHLLEELRPPTQLSGDSAVRDRCVYQPRQQFLVDAKGRKAVREVVQAPPMPVLAGKPGETAGRAKEAEDARRRQAAEGAAQHVDLIVEVGRYLRTQSEDLAALFKKYYGEEAYTHRKTVPREYRELFLQLSADESVMQVMTRPALLCLRAFLVDPKTTPASKLIEIPALWTVMSKLKEGKDMDQMLGVCRWMYGRGKSVLEALLVHEKPPETVGPEKPVGPLWKVTGSCYSMPKIRERPKYPSLGHDQRPEAVGSRGAKCSKYYSQYGEKRLTGGIMAAWCQHSICLGFHCIPRGEGRNDVCSVLYTHWRKAPRRVVYDFACALGPYCLIREADFFADTQFVIDDFHAKGHTKCSSAAFLKTYAGVDPSLLNINSSAAECGNSAIKRIRKSVIRR